MVGFDEVTNRRKDTAQTSGALEGGVGRLPRALPDPVERAVGSAGAGHVMRCTERPGGCVPCGIGVLGECEDGVHTGKGSLERGPVREGAPVATLKMRT